MILAALLMTAFVTAAVSLGIITLMVMDFLLTPTFPDIFPSQLEQEDHRFLEVSVGVANSDTVVRHGNPQRTPTHSANSSPV